MKKALIAFAMLVMPLSVSAAEVRLEQQPGTRQLRVVLDTQGEAINAIEGIVEVPGGASQVALGDSIVPLWVERPTTSSLRFSGIVPGGFVGDSGSLFSVTAARAGQMRAVVGGFKAYRNDGAGSLASSISVPLVAVIPESGPVLSAPDSSLPEFAEVRIERDPAVFDGAWFAAFNARDAGTGVAFYEIAEHRGVTDDIEALAWRKVDSPALLEDQSRKSTVYVRATDGAGNARIERVDPQERAIADPYAIAGAIALLALAIAAVGIIRKTRS